MLPPISPAPRSIALFLVLLVAAGCTPDNKVAAVDTDNPDTPDEPSIVVTPDELYFDALAVGASQTQTFVVSNVGSEDLHVASMDLYGAAAFTLLSSTEAYTLAPAQSIEFTASYSPTGPEERAQLHIASDDAGNPDALVDMEGAGLFPELRITPNPFDFGRILLDCPRSQELTLANNGLAPLTLQTLAQIGDGWALDSSFGLPYELAEGATVGLTLTVTPTEEGLYSSEVYITSNDTIPTQTASQTATGTTDPAVEDEFWQGDGPWEKTDILFYVDQSGSMRDNQRNLADNFENFAMRLDTLSLDWQVMVSTKDTGCHNGEIFTADTPDAITGFIDAVGGRGGQYTERGFTVTYNALQENAPGGCNEGFLRENSKTMLIMVSDEPEQSSGNFTDWVPRFTALAPTASVTAIAGPVPAGCEEAEPGTGYYEASVASHGAFLDICQEDWSSYFETIASLSATGQVDTFYLSSQPDPATIEVTVTGITAADAEWDYDGDANAIVFDGAALPAPGAHIVVDYQLLADCEG